MFVVEFLRAVWLDNGIRLLLSTKDPASFISKELYSLLDLIWIEKQLLSSLQNNKPAPTFWEKHFSSS